MLHHPQGSQHYVVLGIDPGVNRMGFGVIHIELHSMQAQLIHAGTLSSIKLMRYYGFNAEQHSISDLKLKAMGWAFKDILATHQPHCVVCEGAYVGEFVTSYESLIKTQSMLRHHLRHYDPHLSLTMVDAPRVKNAIGVCGRGRDKELMQRQLLTYRQQLNTTSEYLMALDNNAVDAVAVAWWMVQSFIGE